MSGPRRRRVVRKVIRFRGLTGAVALSAVDLCYRATKKGWFMDIRKSNEHGVMRSGRGCSRVVISAAAMLAIAAGQACAQLQAAAPIANHEVGVQPVEGLAPIAAHDGPVVQIALLLDTSNSMDGLIGQAKAALWAIVNDLSDARAEDGAVSQIQIALYEYGNSGIARDDGFVRLRTSFTTDLDLVSEQLFGLRTNGGSEFCGRAIDTAVRELSWWIGAGEDELPLGPVQGNDVEADKPGLDEAALDAVESGIEKAGKVSGGIVHCPMSMERVEGQVVRMIVIAGNEPFFQGMTAYQEAIASARDLGIRVSTVHCGPRAEGVQGRWEDGARLGNGLYAHIDQNQSVAEPPTPFDDVLGSLTAEQNATYLPYNTTSAALGLSRQMAADSANSSVQQLGGRAESKIGFNYVNSHWDIVDAVMRGEAKLSEIPEDKLPEILAEKSGPERRLHIEELWEQRQQINEQLAEVLADRSEFIDEWREDQLAQGAPPTFDQVIVQGIREQVQGSGFTYLSEQPEPSEINEPAAHENGGSSQGD